MSIKEPTDEDPYRYQCGFGNHHVSEAIPGALPRNGTNLPQKCDHDLVAEHLNGTSFISSRETVSNTWMYRIRPACAHSILTPFKGTSRIESCFLPTNPNVDFTPLAYTWGPLRLRDAQMPEPVTFVQGLRTIGGHGDPTLKEGLALHQYAFNKDMNRQAFVNNDGEFLIVPQQGSLDIQTELGQLRVGPGTIAVIPPGFRFRVCSVPSNVPADSEIQCGYVFEIFGSHFSLPELGPIGANGLAHLRDFEYPVARFDLDPPGQVWEVALKLGGRLFTYDQPHTPFDVVAWHGKYAPYRYELSRFAHLASCSDQLDPSAFCVLTARSKWPGVSLVDFCIFGEKWLVAENTLRIPYHHRTLATELCGLIHGSYKGSVRSLEPGGLTFEQAYMPHGETYEAWQRERDSSQGPLKAGIGYLGFMFHVSSHVGLTRWAIDQHPDIRPEKPGLWDSYHDKTLGDIPKANSKLRRAGMPTLENPSTDSHDSNRIIATRENGN